MKRVFFLTAVLYLIGCGSHHDKLNQSFISDNLNTDLVDEELIVFENVFSKVIAPNCLSCHRNYSSYQSVSQSSLSILERIKGEGFGSPMPLGGAPLDDELILLFETWVAQGALEF
jgi:hypothetical protein